MLGTIPTVGVYPPAASSAAFMARQKRTTPTTAPSIARPQKVV